MKPIENERQMFVRNTGIVTAGIVVLVCTLALLIGSCMSRVEQQRTIRHHDSVEACKTVPDPQQCLVVLENPYGNVFGR